LFEFEYGVDCAFIGDEIGIVFEKVSENVFVDIGQVDVVFEGDFEVVFGYEIE
jgi:hypothetical protein